MSGFTDDTLLGGRVMLRQPARGFRAAVDAVLLAAFIPSRSGQRVLEAGCGSGAVFLCLAARVEALSIVAIEREPSMAALARDNAARNGLADAVRIIEGDIADAALARGIPPVDHAFANPPFWPGGTRPPDAERAAATHEADADLDAWARLLVGALNRSGTASIILPASRFDAGIAAFHGAGCGAITLLPVAPREGSPARRVLLRATLGSRAPAQVLPPFILHSATQGYTAEAERVLRDGAAMGVVG